MWKKPAWSMELCMFGVDEEILYKRLRCN
jgi:hypothetical protein